jgi:hypothetical protein
MHRKPFQWGACHRVTRGDSNPAVGLPSCPPFPLPRELPHHTLIPSFPTFTSPAHSCYPSHHPTSHLTYYITTSLRLQLTQTVRSTQHPEEPQSAHFIYDPLQAYASIHPPSPSVLFICLVLISFWSPGASYVAPVSLPIS